MFFASNKDLLRIFFRRKKKTEEQYIFQLSVKIYVQNYMIAVQRSTYSNLWLPRKIKHVDTR